MTAEGTPHEAAQQAGHLRNLAQNQGPDSQTEPFNGFANPTPREMLENQILFRECVKSETGALAPIGNYDPNAEGKYVFCTYGRLDLLEKKVDDKSEEIKKMRIVGGQNGSDVFGHDNVTGAWARWRLAPGQQMIIGVDKDDNLDMAIR